MTDKEIGLILAELKALGKGQEGIKRDLREYAQQAQDLAVDQAALSGRVDGVIHRVVQLEANPGERSEGIKERIPWWGYIMAILAIILIAAFFGLRQELLKLIAAVPVP